MSTIEAILLHIAAVVTLLLAMAVIAVGVGGLVTQVPKLF